MREMKKIIDKTPEKMIKNMMKSFLEVDREIFKNSEIQKKFISILQVAFKSGYKGAKQDAYILKHDWGFDLKEVTLPIYLYHGMEDLNVSIETAEYVVNKLPNCIPKVFPKEGHISLIEKNFGEIMELLNDTNNI